jgi:hypothetical protein
MNRFLPAILGVAPSRVAELWVQDRQRGSGESHYGLSRTFVVLRDLLALPLLVRRSPVGSGQIGGVGLAVAAILGVLGWPARGASAARVTLLALLIAAAGWAMAHDVGRWKRAQAEGAFRVRRLL